MTSFHKADHENHFWADHIGVTCPICHEHESIRLSADHFDGVDVGDYGAPYCTECETLFTLSWKLTKTEGDI